MEIAKISVIFPNGGSHEYILTTKNGFTSLTGGQFNELQWKVKGGFSSSMVALLPCHGKTIISGETAVIDIIKKFKSIFLGKNAEQIELI